MQNTPKSNHDFDGGDLFEILNQYLLLFFGLSCILSSVFIQQIFVMLEQFRVGISIAPTVGIILPIYILSRRFEPGFRKQLWIKGIQAATTIYVVLATLTMVVVIDHVYLLTQRFMPTPSEYLEGLRALQPDGVVAAVVTFIGLCIIVPISEEIVFRGVVQRVFSRNMGGVVAMLLTGVFFGVIHLNPHLLPSMTCFGIFVGFIFLATSNLTYTILSHAVLNTVAFMQLTLGPDSLVTTPFYVQEGWMLAVAVAFLVVLLMQIKRGAATTGRTPSELSNDPDNGK
ncbi:MAG: CPBP family intramembrane metalloprotease [Candidatus Krumholzibacteria bacterium]|nr:CPBP family intramembrane metalloprotease [Candidatus Krumholzibacteria bacterium]